MFLTTTSGTVKHYCTYSLTFTEGGQITKYYTRITETHMPKVVKHSALMPCFARPCRLEYHLGCNVPTSLKTTITTHVTGWELHSVNKYMSCLLLITEISPVFSPAHPVSTQEAQKRNGRMNIFIPKVLKKLYIITNTHLKVLAETVEQVLCPEAALPSKPFVWLLCFCCKNIYSG